MGDGVNQNSSRKIVTSPGSYDFTLYGLSAFTKYSVSAVAIYNETNCNTNRYNGEAIKITTMRKCMCIHFCVYISLTDLGILQLVFLIHLKYLSTVKE